MTAFKDHFSGHAATYARYRPGYPDALFGWLAARLPARGPKCAWDCATGSGQAALSLARHVDSVVATDASAAQIANATPHARVRYAVAPAEASGLPDASMQLVTVAQALHWFDGPRFYQEVARVLVPGGLLAVWTYRQCRVSRAVDAVIESLYDGILGEDWPPERRLVESGYRGILPDWQCLAMPVFETRCDWDVDALAGYLSSWSATQRYRRRTGEDPVAAVRDDLETAFGAGRRDVRWEMVVWAGRPPESPRRRGQRGA